MKNRSLAVVLCALLLVGGVAAHAQLQFDFNPAGQTGAPGTSVTYNATIANVGADTLFLNGDGFSGLAAELTLDDTLFFTNTPPSLLGGDSFTTDIFTVSIDNSVAPGDYFGTFTITGGGDANAQDTLASQNFELTVASAVPELSPALSLGSLFAMGGTSLWLRRRRRSCA